MTTTGICPNCKKVVSLTKNGKLFRHGYRFYAQNIDGTGRFVLESNFKMKETKSACIGSGKDPLPDEYFNKGTHHVQNQ